jgi:transposase-like protein
MRRFTVAEKLKAVRLRMEEGFSLSLVCQELNVSKSSLEHWLQAYRLGSETGLQPGVPGPRQNRLPAPITVRQNQKTNVSTTSHKCWSHN